MKRLTETDTGLTDFLYSYCFIGVVAILKHLPERIMASITLPQLDCILQMFFLLIFYISMRILYGGGVYF